MERTVRTPDGRTLAVEDAGDPAGRPVIDRRVVPSPDQVADLLAAVRAQGPRGEHLYAFLPSFITGA